MSQPAIQCCVQVNTLQTTIIKVIRQLCEHLLKKKVTKEAISNHHAGTQQKQGNGVNPLLHSITFQMIVFKSQHFLHYVKREEKVYGGVGFSIVPKT
jgi:hypothetical protein